MKSQSLKRNAVLNIITTVLGIVFPLITFPYVSRVLGVETIGIYNFSSSIISYFFLLARFVDNYAIREGAKLRNDINIKTFVNELFSINLIATLFSYCLLFSLVAIVPKFHSYFITIAILSFQLLFRALGALWLCNIYEDFLAITIRSLFSQLLSLVALFLFVKTPDDLYFYCAIVALSSGAAEFANLLYARKKYVKFRFVFKLNLKTHLKPILTLFVTSLTIIVYVSSDTTMLGFLKSDYEVGLYSTSVKVYTILKSVLSAIVTVLIPRFSLLFNDSSRQQASALFSKAITTIAILAVPTSIGLFMESREIILLIAGASYLQASSSLKLLSIAILFSIFAYLFTQCILVPLRKEKIVFKITLISAVCNVLLNFVFIPILGIDGAAITTIIAEAMVCLISYFYVKNEVSLSGIRHDLISCFISSIGIIICCYFLNIYIVNEYIDLFVSIIVSIIVYAILLVITKNNAFYEIVNSVKNRFIKN